MSSLCEHPAVQFPEKCKANLAGAKAAAGKMGLKDPLATNLINRCAPCMMKLGRTPHPLTGKSMCDGVNDISEIKASYKEYLSKEVYSQIPETCLDLVAMVKRR